MTVESLLQAEFPEATAAECTRFVRACQHHHKNRGTAELIKEDAERMLEEYMDFRACHGLDYFKENGQKKAGDGDNSEVVVKGATEDERHWNSAVNKALEVAASIKRGQELAAKLKKDAEIKEEEKEKEDPYAFLDKIANENSEGNEEDGEGGAENDEKDKPEEKAEEKKPVDAEEVTSLPQVVYMHEKEDGSPVLDVNGKRIIHVLPARVDVSLANADTYSLALALYLDLKFDRDSEEKVTVVLDTRPGDGWANHMAYRLVNFIRKVSHQLQTLYPERLDKFVIYNIPRAAMVVWNTAKRFMRNDTMDKVILLQGPALRNSPLPREQLIEHFDKELVEMMEEHRTANFKPVGTF
jgi:hypothetical protein